MASHTSLRNVTYMKRAKSAPLAYPTGAFSPDVASAKSGAESEVWRSQTKEGLVGVNPKRALSKKEIALKGRKIGLATLRSSKMEFT